MIAAAALLAGSSARAAEARDTVYLRDGTLLRGVIQENKPGDHVTLQLVSGRVRTVPYSEIQNAEELARMAGASDTATAPSPQEPVPAAAPATPPSVITAAPPAPAGNATLSSRGRLPLPVPASLAADPMASLDVLGLLQTALTADASGRGDPLRAANAWHDLEKLPAPNPYQGPAAERAAEWEAYVQFDEKKSGAQKNSLQALQSASLGMEIKKQLLVRFADDFGTAAAVEMLASIPASPERAELCSALTRDAVTVQIETSATAVAYLDDRPLGGSGTYSIPACSLTLRVADTIGHVQVRSLAEGIPPKVLAHFSDWDVKPAIAANLRTKLVWLRVGPSDPGDLDEATAYCAGLPHDGAPAWRLPTREELEGLLMMKAAPAKLDNKVFPNTPLKQFWTTTEESSRYVWTVDFRFGSTSRLRVTERAFTRCVHDR